MLRVESLDVNIGAVEILRSVSFELPKGSMTGLDRKSTRLNSSHVSESRMPSSA